MRKELAVETTPPHISEGIQRSLVVHGVTIPMTFRTVLVIDDDPDIRELIAQVLSDEGYGVVTIGDGQAAIALVEAQQPGLILLDLMMPKMSGWQVMRALKASEKSASVPVILLSASRDLEHICQELGATGCMAKPFDLNSLIDLVAVHLGPPDTPEEPSPEQA